MKKTIMFTSWLLCMSSWIQASVILEGTVVIAAEDNDFNTIAIDLLVDDGEKGNIGKNFYRIDLNTGKGKELLKKVYEKLKVTGTVTSDNAGGRHITVFAYETISSSGETGKKPETDEVSKKDPDLDDVREVGETEGTDFENEWLLKGE